MNPKYRLISKALHFLLFLAAVSSLLAEGTKLDRLALAPREIPGCEEIDGIFAVDAQTRLLYQYDLGMPPLIRKWHQSFQCDGQKGSILYFQYPNSGQRRRARDFVAAFLWGDAGAPTYQHPSEIVPAENVLVVLSFRDVPPGLRRAISDKSNELKKAQALEIERLTRQIRTDPADYAALAELGRALLEAGDSRAAMPRLLEATRLKPDRSPADVELGEALRVLGEVYLQQGRKTEAITALHAAIQANPNEVGAYISLGGVYSHDPDNFQQGIDRLEFLLQQVPHTSEDAAIAYFYLGKIYEGSGREEQALEMYEEGLKANPDDHNVLNNAAWLYTTAKNPRLRSRWKALEYASKAVEETAGRDANYLDTLATAYFVSGQLQKAIETMKKAVSLRPANTEYKQKVETWEHRLAVMDQQPRRSDPPVPTLKLTGTQEYEEEGKHFTRFLMAITNPSAFPDGMFEPAPDLPPCGGRSNASRTWVEVFSEYGTRLHGFCAFSSVQDLGNIWFAAPKAQAPRRVYVVLADRRSGKTHVSNLISLRH